MAGGNRTIEKRIEGTRGELKEGKRGEEKVH